MRKLKRKILALCLSTILSLFILEAGLRLFTNFPMHNTWKAKVKDERLHHRHKQSIPGIDARGFRNPKVLDKAYLVALGDSHTYGHMVQPEDAWPRQLEKTIGRDVYNFGIGGYGVFHYYALMDDALAMDPQWIVVGLFLHNDIRDMCRLLDEAAPYWRKVAAEKGWNLKAVNTCCERNKTKKTAKYYFTRTAVGSAFDYYVLIRLKFKIIWALQRRHYVNRDELPGIHVNDDKNKTIITYSRIKGSAPYVDLTNPTIAELYQFSKKLFEEMNERSEKALVKFGVVFLPSKEVVFYDYMVERGYELPQDLHDTVKNELEMKRGLIEFFDSKNIRYVDATPYMIDLIHDPGNIYPDWADCHPLAAGQAGYAHAVLDMISRDEPQALPELDGPSNP